jgi:hypothetical protein
MAATKEKAAKAATQDEDMGPQFKWRVKMGYWYYGPEERDKNSTDRIHADLKKPGAVFIATEKEVAPERFKLVQVGTLVSEETPPPPPPRRVSSQRRKVEAIDTMLKEPPEVT